MNQYLRLSKRTNVRPLGHFGPHNKSGLYLRSLSPRLPHLGQGSDFRVLRPRDHEFPFSLTYRVEFFSLTYTEKVKKTR